MDEKILNRGLAMALEFGPTYGEPIQKRLSGEYHLPQEELDAYEKVCRSAMYKTVYYIPDRLAVLYDRKKTINEQELINELKSFLELQYPWIDEANFRSIAYNGRYFACKDGLGDVIS